MLKFASAINAWHNHLVVEPQAIRCLVALGNDNLSCLLSNEAFLRLIW